MALSRGARLGEFEIISLAGAGGMGEVYRARDEKLGRNVAIKVLPAELGSDPERLARFEREAKILGSLSHANVATLYGFHESDGQLFLAMEWVDGETLAERLGRGPMPPEEALEVFREIAAGLEAAHAKGIVHRDLKPANVKLTKSGRPKILDFGLAKAIAVGDVDRADTSDSPTRSRDTAFGMILGTAPYMSPEQARGRPVDKRTDVWAFGCCLYEALAGERLFRGDAVADIIGDIVHKEPDWTRLPSRLAAPARRLLKRCLQKKPEKRLRDMGDAVLDIDEALDPAPPEQERGGDNWRAHPALLLAAVLLGGIVTALAWLARDPPDAVREPVRFAIDVSPPLLVSTESRNAGIALSPDGRRLVYVVHDDSGESHLYLRELRSFDEQKLPGTSRASAPFFAPDGEWIGYFAQGELRKTSIRGAPNVALARAGWGLGGTWVSEWIFFAPSLNGSILRVSAEGGEPEPVTTLDEDELTHMFPRAVPASNALVFTALLKNGEYEVGVVDLDTGGRTSVNSGKSPIVAASRHLLYVDAGTLMALPFDAARGYLDRSTVPVLEGIHEMVWGFHSIYDVSENGTLAYVPGSNTRPARRLFWVRPDGETERASIRIEPFIDPSISPDGRRLAVAIDRGDAAGQQVWILDFRQDNLTRLTFGAESVYAPIWTPDGETITYTEYDRTVTIAADGSGGPRVLFDSAHLGGFVLPTSWTPDGEVLALTVSTPVNGFDVWVHEMGSTPTPRPFLSTGANELQAVFSPNGRFVAYVSDETGAREVYVQPWPGPGGKLKVSSEGGSQPRWSRDGRALYFIDDFRLMVADIETDAETALDLVAGPLRTVVERYWAPPGVVANYDVDADGRVLTIEPNPNESASTEIHVVLSWDEEVKRLAPPNE